MYTFPDRIPLNDAILEDIDRQEATRPFGGRGIFLSFVLPILFVVAVIAAGAVALYHFGK